MKNSLIILLCFAAGVLCSYWGIIPECDDSLSLYILYVMMFLVGIGLGSYNPQIQISEKSQTKRLKIADSRKTKRPIIDKRTTPNKRHSNAIITL